MYQDPEDCEKYGRSSSRGPDRAKIFEISTLMDMWTASRQNRDGPTLRSWTCSSLFLRKSEAANLRFEDIEMPLDKSTGEPLCKSGLPRYVFVHI